MASADAATRPRWRRLTAAALGLGAVVALCQPDAYLMRFGTSVEPYWIAVAVPYYSPLAFGYGEWMAGACLLAAVVATLLALLSSRIRRARTAFLVAGLLVGLTVASNVTSAERLSLPAALAAALLLGACAVLWVRPGRPAREG